MLIGILVAFWIACGVLAYGLTLGFFQTTAPFFAWPDRRRNQKAAVVYAACGPVGALAAIVLTKISGAPLRFHLRCLSAEESWRAHKERWPGLTREDWLKP